MNMADLNSVLRPTILIVDDTPDNITLLHGLLKDKYKIKAANNGIKALAIACSATPPDLILLDIMMPGISGYEVCKQLKTSPVTQNIPIIFLTAMTDTQAETKGLQIGAADFISKPVNPLVVLARVDIQLKAKAAADFLRDKAAYLENEVDKRTQELSAIQNVTIQAMASLAETRDNETGNHIRRTQFYVKRLAEELRSNPHFRDVLTDEHIDMYYRSAPLHDIGKVGIPDSILLKPGKLTPVEFEIMKTHTTLGRDAIHCAEERLGMDMPFLSCAKDIAYYHQEKWDGSGYPDGKKGLDIPFPARLMAVADVYDALISKRPYKDIIEHKAAVKIIEEGSGSHFDPEVVDAFLNLKDDFKQIASHYADEIEEQKSLH
jgi:putative two-component system response regulator